ncbi:MAG: beta-lactamase family protein [Clostridiales bacterium]|nr:beta-lactamase family protein [Clostridiales bacterium]
MMAENDIQQRLTEFIIREVEYWDFWGAIRIVKKGKTLWETSRGYSCVEFGVKNTMSTRFTLASVTKQFTAFAVMLLKDRGLLSLEADANIYLPEDMRIPAGITVHDLLAHTSGLYNFYNFEDDFYIVEDRLPYDRKAFFNRWILKQPMNAPGELFNYNNSNYNLLGWIIEHVSKESYADFLRKNIFLPLGMTSTVFDDGLAVHENKANNYMHDYGQTVRVPYVNNLFLMGAGALVSNCDDLQKWYECLKQRKLLSEKAYQCYFAENMNHYCYGLERHERNGATMYAHGGDANGIAAYTQYFFEDDLCIFILSNNESLNQYRLGAGIADILFGKEPQHTVKPNEVPVSEEDLRKYVGSYLPGKIHIEAKNGKLYLVRVNQNIHIELYCIGPNTFVRRHEEQSYTHNLLPEGSEKPVVWGYELIS